MLARISCSARRDDRGYPVCHRVQALDVVGRLWLPALGCRQTGSRVVSATASATGTNTRGDGMPSCVRHPCRHMASDLYSGVVAPGDVPRYVYVIVDAVGVVANAVCAHNTARGDACVMRVSTHGRGDQAGANL